MTSSRDVTVDLNNALQFLQSGQPQKTEEICTSLLQTPSTHKGDILHIFALAKRAQGAFEEALDSIEGALQEQAANASYFNTYGLILLDLQKIDDAITTFESAIKLDGSLAAAHTNLAHALARAGKMDRAQQCYRQALSIDPEQTDALVQLILILRQLDRHQDIDELLNKRKQENSNNPGLLFVHGLINLDRGELEEAERSFSLGLKYSPKSVPLLGNLGVTLSRQGKKDQAVQYFRRALTLDPQNPDLHINLADSLKYDSPTESREHIEQALLINPSNPGALDMLGFSWILDGDLTQAISAFDSALEIDPSFQRATNHKAVALFLSDELGCAWDLYADRYGNSGLHGSPIQEDCRLASKEDLSNSPVLIWADQGIGDEILQLGMVADLVEKNDFLYIATSDKLGPLVERSFPTTTWLNTAQLETLGAGEFDFECQFPAACLGQLNRRSFNDFPSRQSYLVADKEKANFWRKKYVDLADGRMLVGLSWKSMNAAFGRQKSLQLRELNPILKNPDTLFVSLQYGDTSEEIADLPDDIRNRFYVDDNVDPYGDLDSLAAQILALDLTISTSSTTAHMAGALGAPTWTLVPRIGPGWLWYWFRAREDSPWYPSMRLFRQSETGRWDRTIVTVEQQLAEFVSLRQRVTTN